MTLKNNVPVVDAECPPFSVPHNLAEVAAGRTSHWRIQARSEFGMQIAKVDLRAVGRWLVNRTGTPEEPRMFQKSRGIGVLELPRSRARVEEHVFGGLRWIRFIPKNSTITTLTPAEAREVGEQLVAAFAPKRRARHEPTPRPRQVWRIAAE